MERTDPLRLDPREPAQQARLWPAGTIPSELHRDTVAEQERRSAEAKKDRETGELFRSSKQ